MRPNTILSLVLVVTGVVVLYMYASNRILLGGPGMVTDGVLLQRTYTEHLELKEVHRLTQEKLVTVESAYKSLDRMLKIAQKKIDKETHAHQDVRENLVKMEETLKNVNGELSKVEVEKEELLVKIGGLDMQVEKLKNTPPQPQVPVVEMEMDVRNTTQKSVDKQPLEKQLDLTVEEYLSDDAPVTDSNDNGDLPTGDDDVSDGAAAAAAAGEFGDTGTDGLA